MNALSMKAVGGSRFTHRLALALMAAWLTGWLALGPPLASAIDVVWTYIPAPGPVADVAAGANGEVWVTMADNRIMRWNGTALEPVEGSAKLVAIAPDGTIWSVTPEGGGQRRRADGGWERVPLLSNVTDISIGAGGAIWYTSQGRVRSLDPGGMSGTTSPIRDLARIAATPGGNFWGIRPDGTVIRPVAKAYQTLPGRGQDIGIGANGAAWLTGPDDSIWMFTGTGWDRAPGAARWVAVAQDGSPWVVNRDGNLYRGVPGGSTVPVPAPAAPVNPATITNRPIVAYLCKTADNAAEPRTVEQIQTMLTGPGGMNDYIKEQSYGALTLNGTQSHGWYPLPSAADVYLQEDGHRTLATDCMAAAPEVTIPENAMLAFFTNGAITGGIAYTVDIERNGVSRRHLATAYGEAGLTSPALVAHEIGHTLGMGHSLHSWDPLGGAVFGSPVNESPVGTLGPGYNAPHRDRAGWIPAARKFVYTGTRQQITLTRLTLPATGDYLMAQIPIPGGQTFFTVELRTWAGADGLPNQGVDGNITPGEAVIVHRVDPNAGVRSEDPNDFDTRVVTAAEGDEADGEGAMWRAGETFTDPASNIRITIDDVDVLRGIARVTIGPATP